MSIDMQETVSLHEVYSVTETLEPYVYKMDIDLTDMNGERYRADYISSPNDSFGLNPILRTWLAENEGAYEILPYEPTAAILLDYENAIQAHVDATARSKQFRDAVTLASYVNSTVVQWATEAQSFVVWRDAVWVYAYTELEKFQSGEREQPSVDDFINELPVIEWGQT